MHAFFGSCRRAGALSLATVIMGALLLGSPAVSAAADREQSPTSAATATAADGEQPTTPVGLETALDRDLQLSPVEFNARGKLAETAAEALPMLRKIDGFAGIRISDESPAALLITGTGGELQRAVVELENKFGVKAEVVSPEASPEATTSASPGSSPTVRPTAPPSDDAADTPASDTPKAAAPGTTRPPAAAPPAAPAEAATSATALLNDYIDTYGKAALSRLQSIMRNADGGFVIRMNLPRQQLRAASRNTPPSPASFAGDYTNVDIAQAGGPAEPLAHQPAQAAHRRPSKGRPAPDVVGGLGTMTYNQEYTSVCSLGFNAFSPTGEPAALSAGHCTMDGQFKDVFLTNPRKDRAAKPGASNPDNPLNLKYPEILTELGTYTFSQFGGPGNSSATETGTEAQRTPSEYAGSGTDVAVISDINDELAQLPAVTDWKSPADPASSGPLVTGRTMPVINAPVCKSGRTTGWTCGTIDQIGIFLVAGTNYATDRTDVRVIQGFGSHNLYSATGDSGGPMITGNLALGVLSAGSAASDGGLTTFGASIGPMLEATGGYTLQLFVQAPQLRSHDDGGTVRAGELIYGSAPAGSVVHVTSNDKKLDVSVAPGGRWSFRAPEEVGVFTFSVVASKGFSTSDTSKYRLIVDEPAPPAPDKDNSGADRDVIPAGVQSPAPLADTGIAVDPALFALCGGALLTAGLALLLTGRRRTVVDAGPRP